MHKFKRITVWYQDEIDWTLHLNTNEKYNANFKTRTIVTENIFRTIKISDRIIWVKELTDKMQNTHEEYIVFTNDYAFIKLLQYYLPKAYFCIFNVDADCVVDEFDELRPNPTVLRNLCKSISICKKYS